MRVISLALFRHPNSPYEHPNCGIKQGSFYRAYLPTLIRAYRHVYPGWEIRIHHDANVFAGFYGAELKALGAAGIVRLVDCGEAKQLCEAMLWRIRPFADPSVELFVCRDMDTCPTFRERAAVEEWIRSGLAVHAMADSPVHSVPLMGGMIGFRRAETLALLGGVPRPSGDLNVQGTDQTWLTNEVWPKVAAQTFSHRWRGRHWDACGRSVSHVEDWDGHDPIGAVCPHIGAAYSIDPVATYLRTIPDPEVDAVETSAHVSQRFAILSADQTPLYAFFLPLTARLWQHVVGYQPFALLVGEFREWLENPKLRLVFSELQRLNVRVSFLGTPPRHRTSTVAQVARLYAGDLLDAQDWAITADVDMWPLNRAWYQPQSGAFHLWYANAYGGNRWPLCYLGAPVALWREVMGEHRSGQNVLERITEQLDAGLGGDEDGWKAWNYDEDLFAAKFNAWNRNNLRVEIPRSGGPPRDRIDRSNWPAQIDLSGKVDAHVLRPGPENWDRLRPILAGLLGAEGAQWADGYVAAWRALA